MKSTVLTLGVLVVGAAIAAEYAWHSRQVADLRREIASLRDEPRTVPEGRRGEAGAAPRIFGPAPVGIAPVAQAAPAPAPREEQGERTEGEKLARWKEEELAHKTAVEAGFAAEAVDREWAPEARGDLHRHVAALLPSSSSVREVECRSSMCRVELQVADAEASQKFMKSAFLGRDTSIWKGANYAEPAQTNPDGSLAVVLYLAREGSSFPD